MAKTRYCPNCRSLRPTVEMTVRAEPLVQCVTCQRALPAAPPEPPDAPPKVLYIGADRGALQLFSESVQPHGFVPLAAHDVFTGLALAAAERPKVILVEAGLPGASGVDACRLLRGDEELRLIPIVLTGTGSALGARAFQAGADLALAKPFTSPQLLTTLRTVLALKDRR